MDFAVLRTQRETKKRVQKTLTLLPLLRYKETNLAMISEFLEFERLAHLIRNVDGQFSLSKADHNVPYHWTVALPTQGKMKNVMKLYPEEQATLWRVQVLDCMLLIIIIIIIMLALPFALRATVKLRGVNERTLMKFQ